MRKRKHREVYNKLSMATVLELILDLCSSGPQLSQVTQRDEDSWPGKSGLWSCGRQPKDPAQFFCGDKCRASRVSECRRGRTAGGFILPVGVLSDVSYSDPWVL